MLNLLYYIVLFTLSTIGFFTIIDWIIAQCENFQKRNMVNRPKIFTIPFLNEESSIENDIRFYINEINSLASITRQTIFVIALDLGSTDDTSAILHKLTHKYTYLYVCTKANYKQTIDVLL